MARRIVRFMAVIGFLLFSTLIIGLMSLVVGYAAGGRFNLTASLPKGLYWVVDRPVQRGSYVMFCPGTDEVFAEAKARGYLHEGERCGYGYRPLLKRVAAVAGDTVSATMDGIWVDGRRLPLSEARAADLSGRPLPRPSASFYRLQQGQLWVMSDTNPRSFDSRYFGPIEQAWVTEVVVPVFTWGSGGTLSTVRGDRSSAARISAVDRHSYETSMR
jgi:conjugative transfer signal peptidase TraF